MNILLINPYTDAQTKKGRTKMYALFSIKNNHIIN